MHVLETCMTCISLNDQIVVTEYIEQFLAKFKQAKFSTM